jgi:hypothetical protein
MDSDEGGTLDRDEVRDLARSLGNQLTEAQLDQAMAEMDEDGSGEVDFEEFFDWYAMRFGLPFCTAQTPVDTAILKLRLSMYWCEQVVQGPQSKG